MAKQQPEEDDRAGYILLNSNWTVSGRRLYDLELKEKKLARIEKDLERAKRQVERLRAENKALKMYSQDFETAAREELAVMKKQRMAFGHLYGAKLILMRLGINMRKARMQ